MEVCGEECLVSVSLSLKIKAISMLDFTNNGNRTINAYFYKRHNCLLGSTIFSFSQAKPQFDRGESGMTIRSVIIFKTKCFM